jgi:SAM-dependent methyltransferase
MKMRLTEIAQQRVADVLLEGDFAVDATAGNGHDTAFLAARVGLVGQVFAFDVQPEAIAATNALLAESGLRNVTLSQKSHAELESALPHDVVGGVGAVMFNLGYLPGGDHAVVTEAQSTLAAIDAALRILRDGGVLTIVAYPGHAGGAAEAAAVAEHLTGLAPEACSVERIDGQSGRNVSPILFVVTKRKSGSPE